jgi:hypothetical protein
VEEKSPRGRGGGRRRKEEVDLKACGDYAMPEVSGELSAANSRAVSSRGRTG